MRVRYSARSHMGKIRKNNEDNLYIDGVMLTKDIRERPFRIDGVSNQPEVFVVCDGMGGEEEGERASLLTVEKISHNHERIRTSSPKKLISIVQELANDVNVSLQFMPIQKQKRVGTTLALAVVTDKGVFPFNIGDSRIYCYKDSCLEQITYDHTLQVDKIRSGEIAVSNSESLMGSNKLTRCIGIGNHAIVESYPPIKGSCRILMCSDGLSDMVSNSEIKNVLDFSDSPEKAADYLLDIALENGGRDNITIIILDIETSRFPQLKRISKKHEDLVKEWKIIRN